MQAQWGEDVGGAAGTTTGEDDMGGPTEEEETEEVDRERGGSDNDGRSGRKGHRGWTKERDDEVQRQKQRERKQKERK